MGTDELRGWIPPHIYNTKRTSLVADNHYIHVGNFATETLWLGSQTDGCLGQPGCKLRIFIFSGLNVENPEDAELELLHEYTEERV